MCLNDKFGGLLRKGGIYIILYAHTCLRLKNVWTLWTLWTIDIKHNKKHLLICNSVDFFQRLLHFFRISCILPSNYSKNCTTFAPQFKIIARSSHVHRVTIAHTYTCSPSAHGVSCRCKLSFKIRTRFFNEQALFLNGLLPIKQD